MLTVADLLDELKLMPPEATVEVWSPADTGGTYDVDVDVRFMAIHDHDQHPVAVAICATRPPCSFDDVTLDELEHAWEQQCTVSCPCPYPADVEIIDRTGHRHPLCVTHTPAAWDDPATRVTAVWGGPGAPGWAAAAQLLGDRWGGEPDVAAWVAHPAPWTVPLPHQPDPAAV